MGWKVPREWVGETAVCIASGPSLTTADVQYVRDKARVIVVNNNYQLAPWADVLYACDGRWWRWHREAQKFAGLKVSLKVHGARPPDVRQLKKGQMRDLSLDPGVLNHGNNGGYQALNLAVLFGATRILLLGYDMKRTGDKAHWHKDHPIPTPDLFSGWRHNYATLVKPLAVSGVTVINCTRETALKCFPCQPLEQALPAEREAVA